jgi:hypothetical protein
MRARFRRQELAGARSARYHRRRAAAGTQESKLRLAGAGSARGRRQSVSMWAQAAMQVAVGAGSAKDCGRSATEETPRGQTRLTSASAARHRG